MARKHLPHPRTFGRQSDSDPTRVSSKQPIRAAAAAASPAGQTPFSSTTNLPGGHTPEAAGDLEAAFNYAPGTGVTGGLSGNGVGVSVSAVSPAFFNSGKFSVASVKEFCYNELPVAVRNGNKPLQRFFQSNNSTKFYRFLIVYFCMLFKLERLRAQCRALKQRLTPQPQDPPDTNLSPTTKPDDLDDIAASGDPKPLRDYLGESAAASSEGAFSANIDPNSIISAAVAGAARGPYSPQSSPIFGSSLRDGSSPNSPHGGRLDGSTVSFALESAARRVQVSLPSLEPNKADTRQRDESVTLGRSGLWGTSSTVGQRGNALNQSIFGPSFASTALETQSQSAQSDQDVILSFLIAQHCTRAVFQKLGSCYALVLYEYPSCSFLSPVQEKEFFEVVYSFGVRILKTALPEKSLHPAIVSHAHRIFRTNRFRFQFREERLMAHELRSYLRVAAGTATNNAPEGVPSTSDIDADGTLRQSEPGDDKKPPQSLPSTRHADLRHRLDVAKHLSKVRIGESSAGATTLLKDSVVSRSSFVAAKFPEHKVVADVRWVCRPSSTPPPRWQNANSICRDVPVPAARTPSPTRLPGLRKSTKRFPNSVQPLTHSPAVRWDAASETADIVMQEKREAVVREGDLGNSVSLHPSEDWIIGSMTIDRSRAEVTTVGIPVASLIRSAPVPNRKQTAKELQRLNNSTSGGGKIGGKPTLLHSLYDFLLDDEDASFQDPLLIEARGLPDLLADTAAAVRSAWTAGLSHAIVSGTGETFAAIFGVGAAGGKVASSQTRAGGPIKPYGSDWEIDIEILMDDPNPNTRDATALRVPLPAYASLLSVDESATNPRSERSLPGPGVSGGFEALGSTSESADIGRL